MTAKKTLVVYHGDCTDGFTSAWAAWLMYGDNAEYIPAYYSPDEEFDVKGRFVYFLDYCPSREKLLQYSEEAKLLKVFDHHVGARRICGDLAFCEFDMERSGAGMSWDFFQKGTPRPALVNYVEDRDLWRYDLHKSSEVSKYIFSFPLGDFQLWSTLRDDIENNLFTKVIPIGDALERSANTAIQTILKNTQTMDFLGNEAVPIVNTTLYMSEIGNILAEDAPFAVVWYQNGDGKFKYSLRSTDRVDLSRLAALVGGGGHANAAGFVSALPPWELGKLPNASSS